MRHSKIKIIIYFIIIYFIFISTVWAEPNIKVLMVNEVYSKIPEKNEKIEKLGNMKGDLLVMGSRYSGNIEIWRGNKGLYIVNELPLEEYVKDVVASEVNPDWEMEALKAQAVISRTYALYQKRLNSNGIYHIASSVIHQLYKGNNSHARATQAVEETRGEVLTYDGQVIESLYHSTSCGATENPEEVFGKSYPYLKPVKTDCDISPYATWEREIKLTEIEKALNIQNIKTLCIKSYTSTKRVKELDVITDNSKITINATDFRKRLGWNKVPSTNFSIAQQGDSILLTGNGYGHGVGLCQWCALKLAREGKNYKEILSFYYPGTTIQFYEGF